MSTFRRYIRGVLWRAGCVLGAAALLAACGAPTGQRAAAPGTAGIADPNGSLVVGTVAVPVGFDPHRERTVGARPYSFLVFDRLTRLDAGMKAQPMLATDWQIAPDGLSVTMSLREGVSFHDGTPFDAEAVRVNIERVKTIAGSTTADEIEPVTGVEVLAPHQVRFTLSSPMPELPEVMAGPQGAIISPKAIGDPSVDLDTAPGNAGTGPYVVEQYVPSERVVFTRAPGSNWDPAAGKLASLELRLVGDDRTRMSALQAGEIDIAYVNPQDAGAIKEARALGDSGRFVYHNSPTGVLSALLLRSTVLTNPALRKAIVTAIDRDAIANGLLQGTCSRSDQLARKGMIGYVDDFQDPYPYDPAKATATLMAAGLGDRTDLEIIYISGRQQIPEVVQQQLRAVGIEARLTPLTSVEVQTAFRADRAQSWNYPVTPEVSPGATMDFIQDRAGLGAANPELAALVEKARTTLDPVARDAAYAAVSRKLAEEAFFVPYCHIDAHYLMSPEVIGFDSAPQPYAQFMLDLREVGRSASS